MAKKASAMTDKELAKKAFSPQVRKELQRVLDELNAERPKRQKQAEKQGKR